MQVKNAVGSAALSYIQAIAALALRTDGVVVSWGRSLSPQPVSGLNGVGTAVTSDPVVAGVTSVTYEVPATIEPGIYDIEATYNGSEPALGAAYATSSGFARLSVSSQHQAWRLTYFGTASETGDAANTADPDGDRLSNLIEYAFGLNPTSGSSSNLPVGQLTAGGAYQLSFIQPSNVNDVVYGLEWSPAMQPGSWLPVPDTGSGMLHTFTMSTASRSRAFFRFVIVLSGDECSWALTTISLKKPLGRSVGRGNEGP